MFTDTARRFALEKAAEFDREARRIGICRTVDATEAARWLDEMAAAIREACEPGPPPERNQVVQHTTTGSKGAVGRTKW